LLCLFNNIAKKHWIQLKFSAYNLFKQESEGQPSTEGANSHERSGIPMEGTAYPKQPSGEPPF
jgi:hypothetical protein